MVSQYRPPNVLLQEGSAYKADIDSSITSVGRIAAAYLAHEKVEIAEVSKITLRDDVSGDLDGTFFFYFTPTVDFYIWFNATDISGLLDPGISGATGIRIDFVTDDSAATIAAAMNSIIDAQALMNSFVSGDDVTISNRDDGAVTDLSDGLSGNATSFTFVVLTQGGDGPDDLSIHIDAGYVLNDASLSGNDGIDEIAAQIISEGSGGIIAPSTFPRIDRIVIDIVTGVAELVGGVEAASPVAPDVPSEKAPNCRFQLETTSVVMTDTLIVDERVLIIYGTSIGATFLNAIFTTPFIADFINAPHDHGSVSAGGAIIATQILADDAKTFLVGDMNKVFAITPTTTRILTLATTGLIAGDIIEIHNLAAAQKITIESSDGDDIASFQDGMMRLMALQATPTDRTHWRILEVIGGASPSLQALMSTIQLNVGSGIVKVDFDDVTTAPAFDTNNNFNTSLNRFLPTVPGIYRIQSQVHFAQNLADEGVNALIHKNGSQIRARSQHSGATAGDTVIFAEDSANGLTDYYEIHWVTSFTTVVDLGPSDDNTFFLMERLAN